MKSNITELVFILDKSGSMAGLEGDTIGGYNALIAKQKKAPGEVIVTTVLFDDQFELLHDRINLKGIRPISEKEYFVGGTTALLDAIGKSIHKIINSQKHTAEEMRADKVMFVITTDGMENASHEYTYEKINKAISFQKEKYGWEFIFLGANIDAVETAAKFGIDEDRAVNYNPDSVGMQLNYKAINDVVCDIRANRSVSENWKVTIEDDFKHRGKKDKQKN